MDPLDVFNPPGGSLIIGIDPLAAHIPNTSLLAINTNGVGSSHALLDIAHLCHPNC
jgi:hypothetical protein